jgi:hypothetical protein
MSDGQGFGYGIGGTTNTATDDFVLDFDPEATGGTFGDRVPEGTHKFLVHELYEIQYTTSGEAQIIVPVKVIESTVEGARNMTHMERILIPGNERRENDPEKWKNMMKFLRLRLEGMTGREFRQNNLKFNPAEIFHVGLMFVATVSHEKTEQKSEDGTVKEYTNVRLNNFVHVPSQQESFGNFGGMGTPVPDNEPF